MHSSTHSSAEDAALKPDLAKPAPNLGSGWKQIVLRGAVAGLTIAVISALMLSAFYWYQSRPQAWNVNAITAKFDKMETSDSNNIVFVYLLENHANRDYMLQATDESMLRSKLQREGSLEADADFETLTYPIFVPAHQRVVCPIELKFRFPEKLAENASSDQTTKFRSRISQYVDREMPNLNGFVLFDVKRHYEIDFPRGW